jgi:hypothetical protein
VGRMAGSLVNSSPIRPGGDLHPGESVCCTTRPRGADDPAAKACVLGETIGSRRATDAGRLRRRQPCTLHAETLSAAIHVPKLE